jgi:CheY-like chemotaxis protein
VKSEPCKVLVVDDEHDTVDSMVILLQTWGHEAVAAYSGPQALSLAGAFDPDVVLMDIGMPEMSGFDVAKELKTICPEAKIVALTGFTQADIVRRARDAGIADVVVKPASAAALEDVVDTQCADRKKP